MIVDNGLNVEQFKGGAGNIDEQLCAALDICINIV